MFSSLSLLEAMLGMREGPPHRLAQGALGLRLPWLARCLRVVDQLTPPAARGTQGALCSGGPRLLVSPDFLLFAS